MHLIESILIGQRQKNKSDFAAGRIIEKLEEKGLHIPEDISVVGFDNYLYPGMADK